MESIDDRINKKSDRRKFLKTLGVGGAIGASFVVGSKLDVVKAQGSQIPIQYGSFASGEVYDVFQDGSKILAKNGVTGTIDFTGSTIGDATANIFQPIINALSNYGTSTYGRGGIVNIQAGDYYCTTPWALPTNTANAFQCIFQGSGKSNTNIYIQPSGTVASAIQTGYTQWVTGEYGPKLTFKDLSIDISGTYTGSTTTQGGPAIVNLGFYSVFCEHVGWGFNVTNPTNYAINALYCGMYAGPSEPVTWINTRLSGFLGSASTFPISLAFVWYEGFSWNGGLIELMGDNIGSSPAFGTAFYAGGGHNLLEAIDNYGTANMYNYINQNGANLVLINLEYPASANVYNGTVHSGNGNCLTIINTLQGSAVNPGMHLNEWFDSAPISVKTIGISFGKQSTPFYVPGSGQAVIGIGGRSGSSTPVASKDYRANTDFIINSSGGTGVSISILDDFGNTIASGLTTLAAFRISQGMHINFGAFSATPTVSVYQVGG